MKKTTLIATFGSACLAISACAEADNAEDAAEPADTGTAGAAYDSSSGTVATPPPEPAVNDTDDDGSRLRVGPDGAELEVDGEGTDVRVDSDGPSLEVETEN